MTYLQIAALELGAVRVGRTSWCYAEAQTGLHVVESDDLREFGRASRAQERDAYSLWCARTVARPPTARERRRYSQGDMT